MRSRPTAWRDRQRSRAPGPLTTASRQEQAPAVQRSRCRVGRLRAVLEFVLPGTPARRRMRHARRRSSRGRADGRCLGNSAVSRTPSSLSLPTKGRRNGAQDRVAGRTRIRRGAPLRSTRLVSLTLARGPRELWTDDVEGVGRIQEPRVGATSLSRRVAVVVVAGKGIPGVPSEPRDERRRTEIRALRGAAPGVVESRSCSEGCPTPPWDHALLLKRDYGGTPTFSCLPARRASRCTRGSRALDGATRR
jgi:hypothetical protein